MEWILLNMRLGRPKVLCGRFGEERKCSAPARNRIPYRPACSLVTVRTQSLLMSTARRNVDRLVALICSYVLELLGRRATVLTLILLTWTIWRAPTNASKRWMGFNSAFKGLRNSL